MLQDDDVTACIGYSRSLRLSAAEESLACPCDDVQSGS